MKFKEGDKVKILNNVIQMIIDRKQSDDRYPHGMMMSLQDLQLAIRARHVIAKGYKTISTEIYQLRTLYTNQYYDKILSAFSFTVDYIIADRETTMDRWNKYIRRK